VNGHTTTVAAVTGTRMMFSTGHAACIGIVCVIALADGCHAGHSTAVAREEVDLQSIVLATEAACLKGASAGDAVCNDLIRLGVKIRMDRRKRAKAALHTQGIVWCAVLGVCFLFGLTAILA
jgi:hypothetical protein